MNYSQIHLWAFDKESLITEGVVFREYTSVTLNDKRPCSDSVQLYLLSHVSNSGNENVCIYFNN